MKQDRLANWMRIILMVCAAALVIVLFVPMWQIQLSAPQYPEGLVMLIYPNKLGGNVNIINGLNHYIGMKTLHANDFTEFTVLPYIISFFALFFAVTAVVGRKKLLYLLFILFIGFAILAMVDFWRWEYNYGHNLNPDAAIIVPGMAYQPPLIGYKQLLNFGAYSIPDIGGWIFIFVGVAVLFCTVAAWRSRKKKIENNLPVAIILFLSLLSISSCNAGPEAIIAGKDNCYFCKMGVSDARFGAEIVSKKGKVFKFDDMHCLLAYLKKNELPQDKIKDIYLTNYSGNHQLIPETEALMMKSELLRSPMGGNIAAFDNRDSLKKIQELDSGFVITWNELILP